MVPRLFVDSDLGNGGSVELGREQSHYLRAVLRRGRGDPVLLFNGREGEWQASIDQVGKRAVTLRLGEMLRAQESTPAVSLLFAPVKKASLDYLVQKATELGVTVLQPVLTVRTVVERINLDRLRLTAIEAAEQCGRLTVPEARPPAALDRLLDAWPPDARLLVCDAAGTETLAGHLEKPGGAAALLIGPEGGFDPRELAWLSDLPFATPVSLGPRILRAETAAAVALALWQAARGDLR